MGHSDTYNIHYTPHSEQTSKSKFAIANDIKLRTTKSEVNHALVVIIYRGTQNMFIKEITKVQFIRLHFS